MTLITRLVRTAGLQLERVFIAALLKALIKGLYNTVQLKNIVSLFCCRFIRNFISCFLRIECVRQTDGQVQVSLRIEPNESGRGKGRERGGERENAAAGL